MDQDAGSSSAIGNGHGDLLHNHQTFLHAVVRSMGPVGAKSVRFLGDIHPGMLPTPGPVFLVPLMHVLNCWFGVSGLNER